jgi:Flp pilus assembly protein TadG
MGKISSSLLIDNGLDYRRRSRRRRGAAMLLAVFLMGVLISMLAFSIDIGYLAASKAEMRRTADAAALAGAWQLIDSAIAGDNALQAEDSMHQAIRTVAAVNPVCNQALELQTDSPRTDIQDGYLASLAAAASLSSDPRDPYRAVRVRIQKTETLNGMIPFHFAMILGHLGKEMEVEATAAFATQIRGFQEPATSSTAKLDLLPFALDLETWLEAIEEGGEDDNLRYNPIEGTVSYGSDGIREVNLYPQGTGAPGNRGTVDIGGPNNSTADIARQIEHGVSAEDLNELGKPLLLDDDGQLSLQGDTGISAGVKDELASIVGQCRLIPVFSSVTGFGNRAEYRIVRWVGVRIMQVKLTGPMNGKKLMVQPATMIVRHAVPGDGSRVWSDHVCSPVVLVQ